MARLSALSYKAKESNILVIEDFNFETPKTKEFVNMRNNLKIQDKKILLVLSEQNKNVYLSSRNLKDSKVVTLSDLNTYDIMNASKLVISEKIIDVLKTNA